MWKFFKIVRKLIFLIFTQKGDIMVLSELELKKVNGGAFKFGLGALIGAGITFIIGLIDGYMRPLSCNK